MRILMITGKITDFNFADPKFPTDYSGWFILREHMPDNDEPEQYVYHKVHYRYDQDLNIIRAIAAGDTLVYADDFWPRRDRDGVPHREAFEMHAKVISGVSAE